MTTERQMIIINEIEEKALLGLLKKGNSEAFDKLYKAYSPRIFGRLIRLLGDEDAAEEMLQDLFFRLWEKRNQIDIAKPFKAYLFTIAQHLVYDHFRRQQVSDRFRKDFINTYTEQYEHIEESIIFKQTEAQLLEAVAKLPEQCRKVFILFKFEGKSYAEISELMQISKSTINNHLTKANSILKPYFPFLSLWIAFALISLFE